jgi:hypothetical protein
MSTSEALSCSTRVSSSAINKQGGSDYYKVLPMGTRQDNMYPYSCCGATCSSTQARRSSPAYLGLRCGTRQRHRPALTEAWRSASGPSRVVLLRLLPGALRRHTLEHAGPLAGSLRDVLQQTTDVNWVLRIHSRSTTQGRRQLTFIHCSAWCIASK